ncbi:MAG TPA: metal-sulfur cluster assembly factor [Flavipsychrobacter sp.]
MNIAITDPHYAVKIKAIQALYGVTDPELNINIVDLGLVYDIHINEELKKVSVEMTLSTKSCPLGGIITNHARVAIEDKLDDYDAEVQLVWEPKWNYDKISAEGRIALGL